MTPDIDEALRYLGVGEHPPESLRRQAETIAAELAGAVQPRWVYAVLDLEREGDAPRLPALNLTLAGQSARMMLEDCGQAALLACTIGAEFDRCLRAMQRRDMARAVLLDACGSALVERGCDAAERELAARLPGVYLTDRFSPGYGDLPLDIQPDICAALDTPRRLGLHVTERLLLNPMKSVTAVIGLSDRPQRARIRGCAFCAMRENCQLRKRGERCGTQAV